MPLPSRHARRAFFAKLAAAVGVAALLPRPLRAALQLDSPKITDGDFSGNATIPAGKTLAVKAGATLRAEEGANLVGFPTPNPNALTAVAHDATLSGDGTVASPLRVLSGGSGSGGESATAPKFALFEIPLGIHGPEWTDFELKGSINNFNGLAAQALCYFYGSSYGSGQSTHGPIGTTLACFFTDSLGGDATASAQGAFLATERFRISILRTPLYDQFPHSTAALVEAAITALHEAPLVTIAEEETIPPGYLRFHVLAHADASQTPALREHTLTLEAAFTARKSRYL